MAKLNCDVVLLICRPFTVNQLKEMLKRTGTIVDFWIDRYIQIHSKRDDDSYKMQSSLAPNSRIKSKCCVEFTTTDQASETRMALDGVTWPQSNPKTLRVSFGTKVKNSF